MWRHTTVGVSFPFFSVVAVERVDFAPLMAHLESPRQGIVSQVLCLPLRHKHEKMSPLIQYLQNSLDYFITATQQHMLRKLKHCIEMVMNHLQVFFFQRQAHWYIYEYIYHIYRCAYLHCYTILLLLRFFVMNIGNSQAYQCLSHYVHTLHTFTPSCNMSHFYLKHLCLPWKKLSEDLTFCKHKLKKNDRFFVICHPVMFKRSWHFAVFSRSSVKGQNVIQF